MPFIDHISTEAGDPVSVPPPKRGTTIKRVASATVFLVLFFVLMFKAPLMFTLGTLVVMLVATFELLRMTERMNIHLPDGGGMLAFIAVVLLWMAALFGRVDLMGWVVAMSLMLSQLVCLIRPKVQQFAMRVAVNHFVSMYVGLPLALLLHLYLQYSPSEGGAYLGARLILFLFLPTWAADTAAYFGGRRFGRVKLAPTLSPSKTVEGFVFGIVGAIAAALLFWMFFLTDLRAFISVSEALLVGLLVGLLGPAGDLAESALKREARVKDSGSFLPGHGGVMDKIDSLTFTSVLYYAWCISVIPLEVASLR